VKAVAAAAVRVCTESMPSAVVDADAGSRVIS
jgi:hypothetical protein